MKHIYNFHRFAPKRLIDEDIISKMKQYDTLSYTKKKQLLQKIKQAEKKLNVNQTLASTRGTMNRYVMSGSDLNVYKEFKTLFQNTFAKDTELKKDLDGYGIDRILRSAYWGPYRSITKESTQLQNTEFAPGEVVVDDQYYEYVVISNLPVSEFNIVKDYDLDGSMQKYISKYPDKNIQIVTLKDPDSEKTFVMPENKLHKI